MFNYFLFIALNEMFIYYEFVIILECFAFIKRFKENVQTLFKMILENKTSILFTEL